MNSRLCLTIAARIDAALQRELGEGIDLSRMLSDPLYRRDVLLVCDAGSVPELAQLAREFRAAANAVEPDEPGAADSGFSPSRFFNSLFGALGIASDDPPPPDPKGRPQDRSSGRK